MLRVRDYANIDDNIDSNNYADLIITLLIWDIIFAILYRVTWETWASKIFKVFAYTLIFTLGPGQEYVRLSATVRVFVYSRRESQDDRNLKTCPYTDVPINWCEILSETLTHRIALYAY